MASISATFDGDGGVSEIEAAFREASREIVKQCAVKQVANIKERVNRRESVNGSTYKASRRAVLEGGQTLVDTGAMLKALKASGFTDREAQISFGSTYEVFIADLHNNGTRRGLPKRRFFGVGEKDQESINDLARRILQKVLRQKGLGRG